MPCSVEIVMAEFAPGRPTLEPTLSSVRRTWPEATVTLYTNIDLDPAFWGVDKLVPTENRFGGSRAGWRGSDYYQIVGLLAESDADVAIAVDKDMHIISEDAARELPNLAQRFGLCVPQNPRGTFDGLQAH